MSLTAVLWLLIYVVLAVLAFVRPAYGIALYLMTFYASPAFWWWGGPLADLIGTRINLFTAFLLAAAVLSHSGQAPIELSRYQRIILGLLVLYACNALVIHFANAANPVRSLNGMTMIWKQVGLLLLLMLAVRDRRDFNIFIAAILIGSFYIQYEAIINGRGRFSAGRLEGLGAPGVGDANYLAGLMLLVPPLAAYWLFFGSTLKRLFAVVCEIFAFEVILRCNSRGAFLAMGLAGMWLLWAAPGKVRRYAFAGICLGVLAVPFMVRDQDIIERFKSTFASAAQRDASAQSRLDYWKAAVSMIADNPIGSGAEAAFKSERGAKYIRSLVNLKRHPDGFRAVHNGYLDLLAGWGVQGFLLYTGAILVCWRAIQTGTKIAQYTGDDEAMFLGACLQATLLGQLVVALFLSSFDGEWFFWCFALSTTFAQRFVLQAARPLGPLPALQYPAQRAPQGMGYMLRRGDLQP
jgi:O-antigen ligase